MSEDQINEAAFGSEPTFNQFSESEEVDISHVNFPSDIDFLKILGMNFRYEEALRPEYKI